MQGAISVLDRNVPAVAQVLQKHQKGVICVAFSISRCRAPPSAVAAGIPGGRQYACLSLPRISAELSGFSERPEPSWPAVGPLETVA